MSTRSRQEISELLVEWRNGDQAALDRLMPLVYEELRRLARHYMRGKRQGHTLQATALVDEAYIRLADLKRMQWQDRAHVFAVAAQLMRRILVDHARGRNYAKRGGAQARLSLTHADRLGNERDVDLIALDDALNTFGHHESAAN